MWRLYLKIEKPLFGNLSEISTSRNYFDILTKSFKYIIPFFRCDISQKSFEILNENFIVVPQTK